MQIQRLRPLFVLLALSFSASLVDASSVFSAMYLAAPRLASLPDELDDGIAALRKALSSDAIEDRASALDSFVAIADPEAVEFLLSLQTKNSREWRETRDEAFALGQQLAHLRTIIAQMEERKKRDKSLEGIFEAQQKRLEESEAKLVNLQAEHQRATEWRKLLFESFEQLGSLLDKGDARKVAKDLWEVASKGTKVEKRLAAIEWVGVSGDGGTASDLQKLMADIVSARTKLGKELEGDMKRVRQVELRIQREQEQLAGGITRSLRAEYSAVCRTAGKLRQELTSTSYLLEACVAAGSQCLSRDEPKIQKRSIASLSKGLSSKRDGVRVYTLQMLARAEGEEVKLAVRNLLTREKDPGALGQLLLELAPTGDADLASLIMEQFLNHKNWHVQACSTKALAKLRSKTVIPALIQRLEEAEGRLLTDTQAALRSLTGKNYRTNAELWKRWWKEAGTDFVVPELAPEPEVGEVAGEEVGTTLFGIQSQSQRVLFVLDVSGSMDFSLVARDNPTDDPSQPHDMPQEGEISRMTAAKRAMAQALGGLREEALFGIVCYASSVWSPTDGLMTMHEKTRGQVLEMVNVMKAGGGTNIIGALESALEIAGLDTEDSWSKPEVDTIYFLSDGRASVGHTTDPEDILTYVRERNRVAGVVIHTIGLSGAQDAHLLRQLAEENGGTYASR
ncbi:MAG: hypothetical protein ACI841_003733 [Planctomycetota bacterium]|jgi:hypothetical protein